MKCIVFALKFAFMKMLSTCKLLIVLPIQNLGLVVDPIVLVFELKCQL